MQPQPSSRPTTIALAEADYRHDRATEALSSRTSGDDPVLRLIVGQLEDAQDKLLSMTCNYGRCIPDGIGDGVDEWSDEVFP